MNPIQCVANATDAELHDVLTNPAYAPYPELRAAAQWELSRRTPQQQAVAVVAEKPKAPAWLAAALVIGGAALLS